MSFLSKYTYSKFIIEVGNEMGNRSAKVTQNSIYAYFHRIGGIRSKQTNDILENNFLSARFGVEMIQHLSNGISK